MEPPLPRPHTGRHEPDECAMTAGPRDERALAIAAAKAEADVRTRLADLADHLHRLAEHAAGTVHYPAAADRVVEEVEKALHEAQGKLPELRKAAARLLGVTPFSRRY